MTLLENYVFSGCSALTSVSLPESLVQIKSSAFSNCTALESIQLPDGVTTMDGSVFPGCSKLTAVNYPASFTTVQYYSNTPNSPFYGSEITAIEVPAGVTVLPAYVFRNMTKLRTVTLPGSLRTVGREAFEGSGVTGLTLPEGVETIETSAFSGCTGLREMMLPTTVREVKSSAFSGCTGIQRASLPEGITLLDNYVFSNCSGMTSVSLPESLVQIKGSAFSNCTALESIHLPDGITTMDGGVFSGCSKLTEINYPASFATVQYYSNTPNSPFYGSAVKKMRIPSGVTVIPAYAFRNLTTLRTVFVPDSVIRIGNSAFDGDTGLRDMSMGPNLNTIDANAFQSVISEFTIHGTAGTYPETFAQEKGFQFTEVPLEEDVGEIRGTFREGDQPLAGVKVTAGEGVGSGDGVGAAVGAGVGSGSGGVRRRVQPQTVIR